MSVYLSHFLPFKIHLTKISPILIKMVDFKNLAWATSFATRASRKFIYLPYRANGKKSYCHTLTYLYACKKITYGQMEKIPFVIHPRSSERNMVEKKMFHLFFISKIYSHVMQKWRPKTGMAIPYCLCWKLLHTRQKYSDISNLFAKLQHAKAPES